MSKHLQITGFGYFEHMIRAWHIAFVMIVHGIFPDVWSTKASQMILHNLSPEAKQGLIKILED